MEFFLQFLVLLSSFFSMEMLKFLLEQVTKIKFEEIINFP